MSAPRPLVAILSLRTVQFAEPEARIENDIIGDAADVRTILLPNHPAPGDFPAEMFGAAALIVWHNLIIDAAFIARLQNCRAIIRNGVGYDSVDTAAAAARGIPVCNVPDYGTAEVADHALALTLALCRRLFPLDAEAKRLGWSIPDADRMRRLRTLTFGLVGLGRIGSAAAARARAFGFRVIFFDPYVPAGAPQAAGLERVATLGELLAQSDVVSIHCPLTAETRGFIGAAELARMKPTAYLVNTARGDIVQKAPVFAALRAGRLAGAGLDVVENEPLRTADEAATPNLIVTCHAAFCSVEGKIDMRTTSSKIALAAVRGEPVWNRVN
jgi:phosphoglycerate dehydrogenase-like enzyme